MTTSLVQPVLERDRDLRAAIGIKSSVFPAYSAAGAVPVSQTIYGVGCYLYAGETVTNIVSCVTTAAVGTAPTSLKLGLWSSATTPVCLAVTAELSGSANWTSTGWKNSALSSAYSVPSTGLYFAAFWINGVFGTTNLQIATGGVSGTFGGMATSGARRYGNVKTAATTMVAADTGAYGLSGTCPWLGVS